MGRERGMIELSTGISAIEARTGNSTYVKVLAIGHLDEWCGNGKPLPAGDQVSFLSFEELNAESLAQYLPSVIYSPVLAHGFDCIEVALLLRDLGFVGAYRACAIGLPKPEVIEREVRQLCRTFTFEIVEC